MITKIIIFIGVMLLVLLASAKQITDSRDLKRRIDQIKRRQSSTIAPKTLQDMSLRRRKTEARGLSYWILKPLPDSKRMATLLENAGVKMTPKQFIFRRAITTLAIIFLVTIVFGKSILLAIPVGIIVGVWVPFKLLKRKINKQGQAFFAFLSGSH